MKAGTKVRLTSDRYATAYGPTTRDVGVVAGLRPGYIDVNFKECVLSVFPEEIEAIPDTTPLDPPGEKRTAGGTKHDTDKIRMELLPPFSLKEIAKVLTFGAKKYDSWNWTKGFAYSRLIGACERHLADWKSGIDKDPETGLSHLAHLGCCVLFLIWMEKHRPDLDDRFKDPAPTTKTT